MTIPFTNGLDNRVVLVTGAASGIGAATATLLREVGATVVAVDRDEEGLARTFSNQETVLPIWADVSAADDVREVIARCQRELGRLDGIVANAAITRAGHLSRGATWASALAGATDVPSVRAPGSTRDGRRPAGPTRSPLVLLAGHRWTPPAASVTVVT